MSEWLKFQGKEYMVSYAPYDVIETCVRMYQATNCKLDIKSIADGHWYYLEWALGGFAFRYAVPSAVVAYCARRFDKLSPNDLRCPKFLNFGRSNAATPYSCNADCPEYCACAEVLHDEDDRNRDPGDVDKMENPAQ